MSKIILATTSPYRIEALKFLGIDFEAEGSRADESQALRNDPEELVKTLSRLKAEAVAKNHPDAIVIGMDSVGCFNGKILEKPKSKQEGFERLKSLSGQKFQFYTGIFAVNTSTQLTVSETVKSELSMRELSEAEISQYLEQDSHYNSYALGFDPLGHISSSFIERLTGSYNNVLRGIPLEVMPRIISKASIKPMKITICGSMSYFEKLREVEKNLLELKHQVFMPIDFGVDYSTISNDDFGKLKKEKNAIKKHYEKIKESDAILVCNFDKKGIENYIGGNSFLEIGFAYILGKKIFLLNPIPKMLYEAEIIGMGPVILNGDLTKII